MGFGGLACAGRATGSFACATVTPAMQSANGAHKASPSGCSGAYPGPTEAACSATPAVELEDVSFSYGKRSVLQGVSLAVRPGEVLAILGPNGCGKSTTVKLMNRLLSPAAGRVLIGGCDAARMTRKQVARRVAVLCQSAAVPGMSVEQFVMCGRYPHRPVFAGPTEHDREVVQVAMERAGCACHAQLDMARLSGGERQRAYLAAVLAQEAGVVVMDEPTTYLDPTACFELMDMARDLAAGGAAVAMVLHDVPLALSFADRVAVLAQGRVQVCGTPEAVAASGAIDRVFGVRLRRFPSDASAPGRPCYCLVPR